MLFPVVVGLVLAQTAMEAFLGWLNRGSVRAHAGTMPAVFRGVMDETTYARSAEYTLAKSRFGQVQSIWEVAVLLGVLSMGLLPASFAGIHRVLGTSAWVDALWVVLVGLGFSTASLPFDWWAQFRLEERFGFNTSTQGLWWVDRLKGLLLGIALGLPILLLVLKLVGWMGTSWWLWAWGVILGFQLVMLVLAPILILPLFNKLTPLPEGELRDRLLALGERTGFSARTILVMDGSKRSRHSNAFFTGFGRFRKIVLFDTLISQLTGEELEAVLAHEVGHSKCHHIPKRIVWSGLVLLGSLFVIAWLAERPEFVGAFGFPPGSGLAPALLVFGFLSGTVGFWFSPLSNRWSRVHEYEADAYASRMMNGPTSLVGALRKLSEKNLSNLTPHPWYSAWHYSHPTLLERETALVGSASRGEG